jgi:hypothetical protein
MAGEANYLIGRGELLTYDITLQRGAGKKSEVYTLLEAKNRLLPQIRKVVKQFESLPDDVCPDGYAVGTVALNPSYIAKSYFPSSLLRTANLVSLGSRTIKLTPKKWSRKDPVQEHTTTEIFVAGKRDTFRHLPDIANSLVEGSDEARGFARIERFGSYDPVERIKDNSSANDGYYEIGLHLLPDGENEFIRKAFMAYAKKLKVKVFEDLEFFVGSLWFLPAKVNKRSLEALAEFAFVRVIRPAPKLRGFRPSAKRSVGATVSCSLPSEQPLSNEPRVAILDGGLPDKHLLKPWLKSYRKADDSTADDPAGVMHGLSVSSAFLFGPISAGSAASRPFSPIDHIRVLDAKSSHEPQLELYRTLGYIEEVLLSRQYEFLNLSLGPDLPIEDGDVHAWTSVIDDLLSDGDTFMTVAVGNNGELDWGSNNARVQVPADCVNAVSVGAADRIGSDWKRSPYSAIGPGRRPGVIKPDILAFGGSSASYFHTVAATQPPTLEPSLGTSFAAPYALRTAVGIRAVLGQELRPLTIKALLIHSADQNGQDSREVGWGKVSEDVTSIITCPSGVARIIYQGELKPGKYLRAPLPIPKTGLNGRIRLKATFCYASPTDPQDASAYTKAGLDIVFRPHASKVRNGKTEAVTKGFFEMRKYATEAERRSDAGKWETALHAEKSMLGSTLHSPVFDIHYNAREAAASTRTAEKIRYSLVITIEAPKQKELYADILRAHPTILVPIQPQVAIPIRL